MARLMAKRIIRGLFPIEKTVDYLLEDVHRQLIELGHPELAELLNDRIEAKKNN